MAELRSEEEQLDAIKAWWKNNGTSLIAGVVIAVSGVLGWNAWQNYQENQSEAASLRYQQLLSLAADPALDEGGRAEARGLIDEITDNHGRTLYADLAQMFEARLAVAEGDLAAARAALGDVIDGNARDYIQALARLRLARVQIADGNPEAALEVLDSGIPDSLSAQRQDIRGDAFVALERDDEARDAYRQAMALAVEHGQSLYGVQLKLDNLGAEDATL
ncbi:Putative negative regulator of RcsB-dependent stress response [Franzmannia pantelleriensis]|uniref:Ancillary SecYEG translocon subunit n=1 Tax=Franzmannia pantelleriensis TaxID=48727 RepID=A0A1G9S648_9GAMM|nr:tetratricopeptide repeat protein [Halomonas pantelleriensis]SDM30770.1 Putative negative regulator of RcsB-dependent stress response [Halomonas pantelleriensis]